MAKSDTVFNLKEGHPLNPTLQLLRAKRTSALKDTQQMEAQLAGLKETPEASGLATNLRCILGMFRDYIASLDEAIKLAHSPAAKPKESSAFGLKGTSSVEAAVQFGSSSTTRWHKQVQNTASPS